jgi:hypothetical protein
MGKALCLEGDDNAKFLIKNHAGKEKDTYIMPDLGVTERVWNKQDFIDTYQKYFNVLHIEKKTSYSRMNGRKDVQEATYGDIVLIAGIPDVYIGETICDNEATLPLASISIDEPTISLNFLVNDSPFAGREYFERVLLFRPHNVYGPAMGFEHVIPQFAMRLKELQKDASKGKPVRFEIQGSGQQTRSFIYIDDFTEGLLLVLEKGKHLGIYHIGTMDEVSIQTLAEMVAAEMGLQIELIPGKDAEGGTLRRCPDIATLKSLGFSPKVSLQKGLEPTVAWYNAHTKPPARIEKPALFIP